MNETAQQIIARCLDFWREDLYASNGVATPFAARAILGELKLAGYTLVRPVTAAEETPNNW